MRRPSAHPLRLAGGVLASVALFGCDGAMTVPQPEAVDQSTLNVTSQLNTVSVAIHRAYSGDPARMGDTISLNDAWVYVEILDPLQYRPGATRSGAQPFQSPNQVRIGASWETGVPAESFALLDINNDGKQDFRGRWSRQALQNAGLLPAGNTTLNVWGNDNGQRYNGQRSVFVIGGGIVACAFDNGGIVTHPGAGAGGADVSMASPDPQNLAGSNARLNPTTGGPEFRIADDFTVTAAAGCVLSEVVTHGYQTGGVPTWTAANINIRSGSTAGPIVATATTNSWAWTGVYRVFNGLGNLQNTQRPVYRIVFSFTDVTLPPGTYWIDWQIVGGASGWAPYVMLPPDPPGGANPITVFQNGQQLAAAGWQPLIEAPGAETPFLIRGPGAAPLRNHGRPVISSRTTEQPASDSGRQHDRAGN
jgi:hypothetical protein